jgi:hypothetical protein
MSAPWINGAMIDCVRIVERYDYYRRLIPQLAAWGYNTLFWHFTDDQGCSLQLQRRPELASRYALTRDQMKRLIDLAARHGLQVVPEVEALGHTLYITHLNKYRHLFEGSATQFNALCPSHPESLEVLADVLTETAELFPAPYLHVGLDEVQFGDCPRCRRRGLPQWRLFADHVLAVHRIVTGLGKRMILWGDHLVKDARIARRVPRDCIVAHWDYFIHHPIEADNRTLTDLGFQVLGCPATARVFTTTMPDESNLANLREFARIGHAHRARGVIGMINTVWCPERQLGGSTHWGLALGAALFANPKADEAAVAARFVRNRYGLTRHASAALAIRRLHAAAPGLLRLRKALVENSRRHQYAITPQDVADAAARRKAIAAARRRLEAARPHVTLNASEFGMWLLAADLLDEQLGRFQTWQDVVLLDRLRVEAAARGDSVQARQIARDMAAVLRDAARAARRSAVRAERDWKRTRHGDDPRRFGRDGYVIQKTALPGLLDRTAGTLERLALRARQIARTGRGRLGLPPTLVTLDERTSV